MARGDLPAPVGGGARLASADARGSCGIKRRLYQERGVSHYWIVDPEEQVVEIWRPGDAIPHIEREEITWQPTGAASPFSLRLAELFRPI